MRPGGAIPAVWPPVFEEGRVTPSGLRFIDVPALAELTCHPIESEYREPTEQSRLPKPDAILVAPVTFNTINKWTLGVADTLATGILCEFLCTRIPIVAVPYLKAQLAQHPAFSKSVRLLKKSGVIVSRTGQESSQPIDWRGVLGALDAHGNTSMRSSQG